jgi:hypothetical protein
MVHTAGECWYEDLNRLNKVQACTKRQVEEPIISSHYNSKC